MFPRIADGRTDLVFDFIASGKPAASTDDDGVSLLQWCAYYGDVSAIKYLLSQGEKLVTLGENLGLNGGCFHGHWQLCQFLLEHGADANFAEAGTQETPLHSALAKGGGAGLLVASVLLAHGADPHRVTLPGVETGAFMRDCRTKAETPLHRAAAFCSEPTIQLLLQAGADVEARDMHGDTPLSWASWYQRPASVLRLLCYNGFRIHPANQPMEVNLRGKPHLK
jgi:ankyrin repeat protein